MQYEEETVRKIALYYACNFLYAKGYSHPQVVAKLSGRVANTNMLLSIADKAQKDLWANIFSRVQELTAAGATYGEIVDAVQPMEDDPAIVHYICNRWYAVQTEYMENMVEAPGNIDNGIKWFVISSLMVAFAFFAPLSIVNKIIWSVMWLVSVLSFVIGLWQRRMAKQLDKILKTDYARIKVF